ncbi:hypothetical protein FB45DRAFT_1135610 [Roridomyces roridus]|uniref:Uncharacterized protein n=1 Tax=Roridomyces roridus TaxID=1738132 RepID=A0AAD7B192_9AGAR|nr:hypothetical protein FB45DRAFT_1135610 [Roridomyces roridus]
MATKLLDALIKAIPQWDRLPCDTSNKSPFSEYLESPSAYLLVCKSWLRVATPLLYNTVVIRSKAQAKALAAVLSKNGEFGQFVKHLRVEGGFGTPMRTILKSSPNISDLWLTLEVFSSDNTSGLSDGLPLINPVRFILRHLARRAPENKMVTKLLSALSESIPKWDRLSILHLPFYLNQRPLLLKALSEPSRLHTIVVPDVRAAISVYSMFKTCPLRCIQVKSDHKKKLLHKQSAALQALIRFDVAAPTLSPEIISESPRISISLSLHFVPMARATAEAKGSVWKRVLYFALADLSHPQLPLLLVSKLFKQLGMPYYYAHLTLRRPHVSTFISMLEKYPSVAQHIRIIRGELCGPEHDRVTEPEWSTTILSQTTGLVELLAQSPYYAAHFVK